MSWVYIDHRTRATRDERAMRNGLMKSKPAFQSMNLYTLALDRLHNLLDASKVPIGNPHKETNDTNNRKTVSAK